MRHSDTKSGTVKSFNPGKWCGVITLDNSEEAVTFHVDHYQAWMSDSPLSKHPIVGDRLVCKIAISSGIKQARPWAFEREEPFIIQTRGPQQIIPLSNIPRIFEYEMEMNDFWTDRMFDRGGDSRITIIWRTSTDQIFQISHCAGEEDELYSANLPRNIIIEDK